MSVHLMKERKGNFVKTKCGQPGDTTVWWREVTCDRCIPLLNTHLARQPEVKRKRIIPRQP